MFFLAYNDGELGDDWGSLDTVRFMARLMRERGHTVAVLKVTPR